MIFAELLINLSIKYKLYTDLVHLILKPLAPHLIADKQVIKLSTSPLETDFRKIRNFSCELMQCWVQIRFSCSDFVDTFNSESTTEYSRSFVFYQARI